MMCTNCHRPVLPVISLDIDGTLGDYHEHIRRFAQQYLGRSLRPDFDGSMNTNEWWGVSLETYRQIKLAYRQGGLKRSMPLFPDAKMLVSWTNGLYDGDYAEIWISTSRPWNRLDNIDPDTKEWLERNGILYNGLIYGEDKYRQLAQIVGPERVVAVLDDLPEMAVAAGHQGLPAYLIDRPHNGPNAEQLTKSRSFLRANMNTMMRRLSDDLTHWKESHAISHR